MTALSVATPDLNATAASAINDAIRHRPAESILEPAQIVQVDVAAADAQKQSEPSVNQSSVLADAVDTSVVSYKDSILSKFQRRTNDKIMGQMKARDLADPVVSRSIDVVDVVSSLSTLTQSRNCELQADVVQGQDSGAATQTIDREHSLVRSTSPCVGRVASIGERKSLAQARESFEHGASDPPAASKKSPAPLPNRPQDFGELRSSARLAQQRERKAADRERVEEYRERSKEWLKRRGRQPDQDCPGANDVAKTYKEAFRNLSMELKKKISTTGKSPYSSIGSLKEPDDFAKIYTAKVSS